MKYKITNIKIALYACNFGNYRNELNCDLELLKVSPGIDKFLFTDQTDISSDTWNIVHTEVKEQQKDDDIPEGKKMVRQLKYILPSLLTGYDFLIYIDAKYIKVGKVGLSKYHRKNILRYPEVIKRMEGKNLLHEKHRWRETCQEELTITIRNKKESEHYGTQFLKEVEHRNHRMPLVDLGYFIRRVNKETEHLFKKVNEKLENVKLHREQNVYCFVVDDINFPIDTIGYF